MNRRLRLLHAFYSSGSAVQHAFGRRIRPAGAGALLVVSLASFLTIGQPKSSVFAIFAFSLGLTIFALFWVVFRSAKLKATHQLPRYATVGEPVRFSVILENTSRRKLRAALFGQTPPDPRPSLYEFSNLAEPGEEKRNIFDRTMVFYRWQWLLSRKRGFTGGESTKPIDLDPGEKASVPMDITPARRGVIAMEGLRVLLPDPLGFFQKCKPVDTMPSRLVILPQRFRIPRFEMPGSSAFRIGGEETSNSIGTSGEFVGLREYRPGDPLRQIHWKSWAHTGRPMVKELEDTFYPRYGLVLDTFPGSPDEQVFEGIVSIAASFVVGLSGGECLLDLMFIAGDAHNVTAGRDFEKSEKLLEVLAAVHVEKTENFDLLTRTIRLHGENMTSCLIILNGWDDTRKCFLNDLLKSGILCVPLIVGTGETPPNIIGHWIDSNHISRDLLSLPTRLSAAI
ncbi:MAG: DUF58 domain-containing protein [Akkermansiaceae bacterium]|nr:DUF58 domain-containing protein [Akkermansiaceae bacterium]MDP4645995.1 DUF58 domain-containing protein [Akkermansiaceae bacterium]MDP4721863.1 DUF58 domain-containing protein [Akkermansiaceae bacterium]MDP4780115.1 DUF58 domain-containing protein [Akkermansiaceae bacterium]MDP4848570.1 DUF58 domain-containing protein [Akkermansiaceae bacterium]